MAAKTILITGVAGLLGSNLADWIAEHEPDTLILGVDNLSGGFIDNVNDNVVFYQQNLADDDLTFIFSKHNIDIIFHFAAYAAEGLSPFMRVFNYKNNLISTTRLINLAIAHSVEKFVFTSSMATYGNGDPPFDENDLLSPIDPYGIAKVACEQDLSVANIQHGLDYTIIKPHNVYGPKQNIWDRYRNVLGIWMNQHLNGQPLVVFGDGKQRRAFSFIYDVVRPLWIAGISPEASRQIINLGGKKDISIDHAADLLLDVMGDGYKVYKESRHEVQNAWSTWKKSEQILGYEENHTLKDGLEIMWDWAKKQPKRAQQTWESYELDVGLYSFWK